MNAEIISIGDELLIGQVINTNATWIGEQLSLIGISVIQVTSIGDDKNQILSILEDAQKRAQLVVVTGGLGPTKDDITKHTLCEYFKCDLILHPETLINIIKIFASYGREVTEINKNQALVPSNCKVIRNRMGTAPGMWFDLNKGVLISLPGVPYEMKTIMLEEVFPLLIKEFKLPSIFHHTILTQGIGESALADLIENWEESLPNHIKLAYLPSPGQVRLRLSAHGEDIDSLKAEIDKQEVQLIPQIIDYFYGYNQDTLESVLGKLLVEKKATISVAESCTGGTIAQKMCSIAGASNYFIGGIIAYENQVKIDSLGVDSSSIEKFGAVSEVVVKQMIKGVLQRFGTTYAIASTGIAGPSGGSIDKPVGTVWLAVGSKEKIISKCFKFGEHRSLTIERASLMGLSMMRKFIKENA